MILVKLPLKLILTGILMIADRIRNKKRKEEEKQENESD